MYENFDILIWVSFKLVVVICSHKTIVIEQYCQNHVVSQFVVVSNLWNLTRKGQHYHNLINIEHSQQNYNSQPIK